jgi:IS5 family transposase
MGDPLARLDSVIDWSVFKPMMGLIPKAEPKGPGGRPGFPPILMFKVLVIGHLYNLSDAQLEFQITDRHSFKKFLGITDADKAPDEKTIWAFRETLVTNDLLCRAFDLFRKALEKRGLYAHKGQMIDATFVDVPRQRNSREDNAKIKEGQKPDGWDEKPEMARQKDLDARWTKKNDEKHYGYKNHVNIDLEGKLIIRAEVTDAAVHDSQALDLLTREGDPETWLDSGYGGQPCADVLASKSNAAQACERVSGANP